jgi:polar amino acid transport system substrate-binding protein
MGASLESRRPTTYWTALAAMLVAVSLTLSAQTAPLKLVSTAWSPLTNEPGRPRFALDLVEAALGRFDVTAQTTIVSAAEFSTALLTGPFDGSAAAWKDPERERLLLFSKPYLENRLVLVGRTGADVSATGLAALKGKSIAIVGGYSYGDVIDRAGPVIVRSLSEEDSLSRLLKGGVDYTLMDELVVEDIVRNYPKESASRLQIGSTALITRELFLAIRRTRTDAASIVARFNAQLPAMIADRTYHRLLHVDWIRADINGDGVVELVPLNDRPGGLAPQHSYTLFSTPQAKSSGSQTANKPGFYVGGTIYTDWASVPSVYKTGASQVPDPSRSTASIFRFSW